MTVTDSAHGWRGCLSVSQQIRRHYSSRTRLSCILSFVPSGPPAPRDGTTHVQSRSVFH